MNHSKIQFVYGYVKDAIAKAPPESTFQKCLQDLLVDQTFSNVDESFRASLDAHFNDLSPAFITSAIHEIEFVVTPFLPALCTDYGDSTHLHWTDFYGAFKDFLYVASLIGDFSDGLNTAFDFFCEIFRRMILVIWGPKEIDDDYIYLALDETLLGLCKKKESTIDGVKHLQLWRARLLKEKLFGMGHEHDREPFILRSIQYIHEITAKSTVNIVLPKVVGGRLPNELLDMVYGWALCSHNVHSDGDKLLTWASAESHLNYLHVSDCCSLGAHPALTGVQVAFFWSRAERRYIRFHELEVAMLKSTGATFKKCDGNEVSGDARICIRCGGHAPAANEVWELEGLRPNHDLQNEVYFRAGEPAARKWRFR